MASEETPITPKNLEYLFAGLSDSDDDIIAEKVEPKPQPAPPKPKPPEEIVDEKTEPKPQPAPGKPKPPEGELERPGSTSKKGAIRSSHQSTTRVFCINL